MINKITNIQELNAERLRLQYKRYELEADIKNDVLLIKENLSPSNLLNNSFNNILKGEPGFVNNFLNSSLGMGINFLITRVLMRKSGFIKRLIVSWIIKRYGIELINKNSSAIFSGARHLVEKIKSMTKKESNHEKGIYDSTTVGDHY